MRRFLLAFVLVCVFAAMVLPATASAKKWVVRSRSGAKMGTVVKKSSRIAKVSCPGCGYRVEVCGGLGYGMRDVDHTVSCPSCRELSDLELPCKRWEIMDDLDRPTLPGAPRPAWLPERVRCALDHRHKATMWEHPGPCPRCGVALARGEMTVLWD